MLCTSLRGGSVGLARFLVALLLALSALPACSRRGRPNDEAFGVPSEQVDPTPIAGEDGSGPAAASLLPLTVGSWWTYRVEGTDGGCNEGQHSARVLRREQVAGRAAFAVSDYCGRSDEHFLAIAGKQVLGYENAAWRSFLASPLVEGRTWDQTRDASYAWHRIGWVKVEAGLFADCWQRQPEAQDAVSEILCEGAGIVSVLGPNLRVELTSFRISQMPTGTLDEGAVASP